MKFQAPSTSGTYANRYVAPSWEAWCRETLQPAGKDVIDIGCGGGIYSEGFIRCGARSVTGVDFSLQYIQKASKTYPQVNFVNAPCEQTGLEDKSCDIIFERALIHHLDNKQKSDNIHEMMRILRTGGTTIIQDRTIEDVLSASDEHWIRRELMQTFPRLVEFEQARRPSRAEYAELLQVAGFKETDIISYAEIRRIYKDWDELENEILTRKGKSILFELSDTELNHYIQRLARLAKSYPLVEKDLWTVWIAKKET